MIVHFNIKIRIRVKKNCAPKTRIRIKLIWIRNTAGYNGLVCYLPSIGAKQFGPRSSHHSRRISGLRSLLYHPPALQQTVLITAGEYPASAASSIILQPCNRQLSSQQENIRPPQPPLSSSSPAIDSCHHSRRISGLPSLLYHPPALQ